MKSKAKIEKQLRKKTNSELIETIILAKKNKNWIRAAEALSGPRRKRKNINLNELGKYSGTVAICGKVLSAGEAPKGLKVAALDYSEKAKEKLLNRGCEVKTILEEIKQNKDAKGVKIIK